jgi:excisionase family DNA binding protein
MTIRLRLGADGLLSELQAAHRLNVPRQGVLPLAAAGRLRPVVVGSLLLYRRDEVDGLRQRLDEERGKEE